MTFQAWANSSRVAMSNGSTMTPSHDTPCGLTRLTVEDFVGGGKISDTDVRFKVAARLMKLVLKEGTRAMPEHKLHQQLTTNQPRKKFAGLEVASARRVVSSNSPFICGHVHIRARASELTRSGSTIEAIRSSCVDDQEGSGPTEWSPSTVSPLSDDVIPAVGDKDVLHRIPVALHKSLQGFYSDPPRFYSANNTNASVHLQEGYCSHLDADEANSAVEAFPGSAICCEGAKCIHVAAWRRMKVKKGQVFYACHQCGVRWSISSSRYFSGVRHKRCNIPTNLPAPATRSGVQKRV